MDTTKIADFLSLRSVRKSAAGLLLERKFFYERDVFGQFSKNELIEAINHRSFDWRFGLSMTNSPHMDDAVWLLFGMRMEEALKKNGLVPGNDYQVFNQLLPKLATHLKKTTSPYVLDQFSFIDEVAPEIGSNPHCSVETLEHLAAKNKHWLTSNDWNYLFYFSWPLYKRGAITEQTIIDTIKLLKTKNNLPRKTLKRWNPERDDALPPHDEELVSLIWKYSKSRSTADTILEDNLWVNATSETLLAIYRWIKRLKYTNARAFSGFFRFPRCPPTLVIEILLTYMKDAGTDLRGIPIMITGAKEYLEKAAISDPDRQKLTSTIRSIEASAHLSL